MSRLKTVRMKDVAERCGVAESTVSHVLNQTKFVAPETRARVEQAMREMNFHRDSHARRLARGHSNFLGLVISDIENPFYPGVIKSFETAALENGYEVLLFTTHYDPARTEQAFRKMIENKSPGVAVLTSNADPGLPDYLAEHGVASVFLQSGGASRLKANIHLDFPNGVSAAVNYLHHLGHREFALIAGPQNRTSHFAYREAVEAAMQGAGLKLRVIEGTNDVAGGEKAVQTMLSAPGFPTAILCSNDLTAMGAIRVLTKSGLRVPEDVSVVGADDIPFAALIQPSLTTVKMPRARLGRLALEMLLEIMNDEEGHARSVVLETELVIRESTGIAPGKKGSPAGLR